MSQFIEPQNTTNSKDATISEETNASEVPIVTQEQEQEVVVEEQLDTFTSWDSLGISTELLRGIFSYGYENPSPIQQKAIKPIMNGRDIIAQAQSGTGKTATFSIGALSRINTKDNSNQVLIYRRNPQL